MKTVGRAPRAAKLGESDSTPRTLTRTSDDSLAALPQPPASGKKVTHASTIRMAIENDIFTGRLAPGSSVDEEALAARFSVSRTPVREAMLQLIQTGLIEKHSRKRTAVAKLDVRRLIQMFETISELEAFSARLAARRITAAEKQHLIRIHEEAHAALTSNRVDDYARLGRLFHALVIQASHNEVLIDTTNRLALQTVPYRQFQLRRPGRPAANHNDHERILKAILAGNDAEAGDLMRGHVTVQGDVLAEYISLADTPLSA